MTATQAAIGGLQETQHTNACNGVIMQKKQHINVSNGVIMQKTQHTSVCNGVIKLTTNGNGRYPMMRAKCEVYL